MGATTGWQWNNVNDGVTYYATRSPYGTSVIAGLTDPDLTSGRIPIAGTGGLLATDAGLAYNSGTDTLTVGNVIDGTRDLGDATTPLVARVYASDAPLKPAATDAANWVWVCDGLEGSACL